MITLLHKQKRKKPSYAFTARRWGLNVSHWARKGLLCHLLMNENGYDGVINIIDHQISDFTGNLDWRPTGEGGVYFPGSVTDYIDVVGTETLPSEWTIIIKAMPAVVDNDVLCGKNNNDGFFLRAAISSAWELYSGGYIYNDVGGYSAGDTKILALTYDGSNFVLYQDGIVIGTGGPTRTLVDDSNPIRIGNKGNGTSHPFVGAVKYFRFYNRVLSQGEVTNLVYNEYPEFQYDRVFTAAEIVAAGGNAPTGTIYGPLTGPLGGVV